MSDERPREPRWVMVGVYLSAGLSAAAWFVGSPGWALVAGSVAVAIGVAVLVRRTTA